MNFIAPSSSGQGYKPLAREFARQNYNHIASELRRELGTQVRILAGLLLNINEKSSSIKQNKKEGF